MQTINLKKYYYPIYRTDTYLTVPDEVAEALLLMLREELVRRLCEALSTLTPIQARRVHARYMLGMKIREIAEMEGVDSSRVSQSIRGAVKRLRRYFDRQKWMGRSL